jgi:hypothetical protein
MVVEEGRLPPPASEPVAQRHPGFFRQVLFGRKRPVSHQDSGINDDDESTKPQRKRIVSDFTAETSVTSGGLSTATPAPFDSCHGMIPVPTILEGGCESSEHVELDELDDEESQMTTNDDDDDDSVEKEPTLDHSHESSA